MVYGESFVLGAAPGRAISGGEARPLPRGNLGRDALRSGGERILVIGRSGQVARELQRAAWPRGVAVNFLGRDKVDLTRPDDARGAIIRSRPRIVVNAAAFTAVDAAETAREAAFAVNRDGPEGLAAGCREVDATLIHLSTDYVFDGTKADAYREDDPVNPLSVYGASKAAGEAAVRGRLDQHVIIRTSWVYSAEGRNFVRTMLRLGAEREKLTVIDDQRGCPTAAADIARAVTAISTSLLDRCAAAFGTFHFCGAGATTWYGFASEIFDGARQRGMKAPRIVVPITSEAYPLPARRPRTSVLNCEKVQRTYGTFARPWQVALAECLDEIRSNAGACS